MPDFTLNAAYSAALVVFGVLSAVLILSGCAARPRHFDVHVTYDARGNVTGGFAGLGWNLP